MRKLLNRSLVTLTAILAVNCAQEKPAQPASPFDKVSAMEEKYKPLLITEVRPEGWLKKQIGENLDGFIGRLDTLVPKLTREDKIYGENRLTKKVKSKDVGALGVARGLASAVLMVE
jgi:hypothetical protein